MFAVCLPKSRLKYGLHVLGNTRAPVHQASSVSSAMQSPRARARSLPETNYASTAVCTRRSPISIVSGSMSETHPVYFASPVQDQVLVLHMGGWRYIENSLLSCGLHG